MPRIKPSSNSEGTTDDGSTTDADDSPAQEGDDDSIGGTVATFLFGALLGAVALFLLESYDEAQRKANAKPAG